MGRAPTGTNSRTGSTFRETRPRVLGCLHDLVDWCVGCPWARNALGGCRLGEPRPCGRQGR
eukprot:4813550-Prorocentrum_lima.AAC.1